MSDISYIRGKEYRWRERNCPFTIQSIENDTRHLVFNTTIDIPDKISTYKNYLHRYDILITHVSKQTTLVHT